MKAYILSIAGVILLSALVAAIAPKGKMGEFVKGMTKLLILAVIVMPLVNYLKAGELSSPSPAISVDSAYTEYCTDLAREKTEKEITLYIEESTKMRSEVSVTMETGYRLKSVRVKITDFGIIGADEHTISMGNLQNELKKRYSCEVEVYAESD